jgi:hypothetical protein
LIGNTLTATTTPPSSSFGPRGVDILEKGKRGRSLTTPQAWQGSNAILAQNFLRK